MALNQEKSFMFVDKTVTAFKFKGNEPIKKGQYRIPFFMTLPQRLPGSFNFVKKPLPGQTVHPENLNISYFFDCYVENMEDELLYQKEINLK
jgi:hypothetical protein